MTNEPIEITLLREILETLRAMKKQEYDYWEAWRKAKANES